jgi:K+-transporting ATPase KdpF subunit
MSAIYWIVGVATVVLFVYLVLALIKPEWFG